MLEKAKKNIAHYGLHNVDIMKMDAMKLDFPDNCFDSVIAAYVISVVPDPVIAL